MTCYVVHIGRYLHRHKCPFCGPDLCIKAQKEYLIDRFEFSIPTFSNSVYLHFQIEEYLKQIKNHSFAAGHPVLLFLILVLVVSEKGYSKHSKQWAAISTISTRRVHLKTSEQLTTENYFRGAGGQNTTRAQASIIPAQSAQHRHQYLAGAVTSYCKWLGGETLNKFKY